MKRTTPRVNKDKQRIQKYEEQISELSEDLFTAREENEDLTKQLKEAESEIQTLQSKLDRQDNHATVMQNLTEEEYEAKLTSMQYQMDILQQRLRSAEASEACVDVLEQERQSLTKRVMDLLKQVEKTDRQQAEEVHRLRTNKDSAVRAFETTFSTMLEKIMDQSDERAQQQISNNIKTKLGEYEQIKKSAETAEQAATRLLEKCSRIQKENRSLKLEVETLTKSNEKLLRRLVKKKLQAQSEDANEVTVKHSEALQSPEGTENRTLRITEDSEREEGRREEGVRHVYPSRVSCYDWTEGYIQVQEKVQNRVDKDHTPTNSKTEDTDNISTDSNTGETATLRHLVEVAKKVNSQANAKLGSAGKPTISSEIYERIEDRMKTKLKESTTWRPQSATSRFQQTASGLKSQYPIRRPQSSRRLRKK